MDWLRARGFSVGVAFVLACAVACGEDSPEIPSHFVGQGVDCGSYRTTNTPSDDPDSGERERHCLFRAFNNSQRAYLSVIFDTTEGHPVREGYQVTADGSVLVETDWNGDPEGPDGVETRRCQRLSPGGGVVPETTECTSQGRPGVAQ